MWPTWPQVGLQNRTKIEETSMQKSIEKSMHLGIHFWKDVGRLLGKKMEACWHQNQAKIDANLEERFFEKALFSLGKTRFFQKIALRSWHRFLLDFWCQHASIFLPKIHQNLSKNRFQDASIFRSIFAAIFSSILLRLWGPTGNHVGHFVAQNTATANAPRVVYVGSIYFFGFLGVLPPSWAPLGSI